MYQLLFLIFPLFLFAETKEVIVLSQSSDRVSSFYLNEARKVGNALAVEQFRLLTLGTCQGCYLQFIEGTLENGGEVHAYLPRCEEGFRPELNQAIEKDVARFPIIFPNVPIDRINFNDNFSSQITPSTKAVILFPGAGGSLTRVCELAMHTLYTGKQRCRLIIYNIDNYWDGFLTQMQHMVEEQFTRFPKDGLFDVVNNYEELQKILTEIRDEN